MRLEKFIKSYDNWCFPDEKTMKMDFSEYKKKEEKKWKLRAQMLKARWPLFDDYKHFKNSLKNAKIVNLTSDLFNKIEHVTNINNIDDLRSMVSEYIYPRDIDRIIKGFEENKKIPYPIILKSKHKYFIMAGNTRQNTASIMNIKVKVMIVDVGK